MSATETTPPDEQHAVEDHHGPSPREYVNIALVLGALTALEVSTYYVEFGALGIPLLIVLMIIKFVMVVNFFMHLKFDNQLYGRFLYGGLALAFSLYALVVIIISFGSMPTL